MSKGLRTAFLVHAVLTLILGLLLFLIPGRFLLLLGWHPIDAVASRLFGAVLLAQVIWGFGYTFTSGATQAWIVDEIGEEQAGEAFLPDSAVGRLCDG